MTTVDTDIPADDTVARLHGELDAALRISAPLAWRLAGETCCDDPDSANYCSFYHRLWQYLALLSVTTSIRTDSAFLIGKFRDLARDGNFSRVLVSGTADYAMLAHILWAYGLEDAPVDVTVLDICQSPLAQNRWYAERRGQEIECVQADILEFSAPAGFDVICSHSFLGWFGPPQRRRLVAKWFETLRPGGEVVTAKRLQNHPPDSVRPLTAGEAAKFRDRVYRAASETRIALGVAPDELAAAAGQYGEAWAHYHIRSEQALRDLFEEAGFQVLQMDMDGSERRPDDRPLNPGLKKGGRLRIVARRPPK